MLSLQWKINIGTSPCHIGSPLPSPDCRGFVKRQHEKSHWVKRQPPRNHLSDHKVTWVDSWVWSQPVAALITKSVSESHSCSETQSRCLKDFWLGDPFADVNPSAETPRQNVQDRKPSAGFAQSDLLSSVCSQQRAPNPFRNTENSICIFISNLCPQSPPLLTLCGHST